MITTTLGLLVNAVPALQRLSSLPLGMKAAYDLSKLTKLVDAETEIFQEQLTARRAACGAAQGQPVPANRMADFKRQLQDLMDVPVAIDWKPFDLAAIGDAKIAAADLVALRVHEPAGEQLATMPGTEEKPAAKKGRKRA